MTLPAVFERYRDLVGDWAAFVDACARPLPTVVWANPLRHGALEKLAAGCPDPATDAPAGHAAGAVSAADAAPRAGPLLERRLRALGLEPQQVGWYPGAFRVPGLDSPGRTLEYYLGLLHVQEEVSLAPVVVLDPHPGERVLDLCAAPGGKTAQAAARMRNRGTLVANDAVAGRLPALRANCERLGALNVVVTREDGTQYPLESGRFDRILLDVPCSCEGNVRDTPEGRWEEPEPFPAGLSGLQATLLGRAWKLLAPGGTLVYSTCTFAPEENEMVLDYVLGDDAEIVPVGVSGLESAPGLTEWQGRSLRPDCRHLARYWPHLNDTGGFAIARVRKATAV